MTFRLDWGLIPREDTDLGFDLVLLRLHLNFGNSMRRFDLYYLSLIFTASRCGTIGESNNRAPDFPRYVNRGVEWICLASDLFKLISVYQRIGSFLIG